ncbi:HMG box family protein [Trichomonas vaginalis G3]|uniref:HMG box family protein n=1 Tax=Trichomonas vaginalis (strain ATCC PRA-98 / G3) TaxID=412133 RepID=A2DRJ7_TRIV3|nr:SRY (sex determining region Y)-box family [Trichomonas vaginalis G3]EAY16960.1 HMG box family protein [Trichomonas vaginalis G3]KAI5508994.1 SRY (sex determining region Y)-box family [Trichomonas vaginalis G3]|eukprot:XP_001329183.1 HMG box family protein [Trichomonas vaginalis G3]
MFIGQSVYPPVSTPAQWTQPSIPPPALPETHSPPTSDSQAKRPLNAFMLYSREMRIRIRQENPSMSNTDISTLLGKLWKEVPNDIKLQFKHRSAKMQEIFKAEHPDYTYKKARRKRALNDLIAKNPNGITPSMLSPEPAIPKSVPINSFPSPIPQQSPQPYNQNNGILNQPQNIPKIQLQPLLQPQPVSQPPIQYPYQFQPQIPTFSIPQTQYIPVQPELIPYGGISGISQPMYGMMPNPI